MSRNESNGPSEDAVKAAREAFLHARQQVEYFGASDTDADPISDALAAAYPIIRADVLRDPHLWEEARLATRGATVMEVVEALQSDRLGGLSARIAANLIEREFGIGHVA